MRSALLVLALLLPQVCLASPRLYVFDCGSIYLKDVSDFGLSNAETDVRELFVPCYMIENAGKRLLWDGGLPLALAGTGRQTLQPGVEMEYHQSLIDQLAAMDLTTADFDFASYSHFHFDHVGAANAFSQVQQLINANEHRAAFADDVDHGVFDPSLYSALESSPTVLLEDDHDVFGDGSVIIVPAPGHTPGHSVLLVNLAKTGPVVLSGDLYHFEASRRLRSTPVFNSDAEETRRSMDKVEALLEQTGATLWIEHNKALAETLDKAPAFYE